MRRKHRVAVICRPRVDVLNYGCAANRAVGRPELSAVCVVLRAEEELVVEDDEVVLRGASPRACSTRPCVRESTACGLRALCGVHRIAAIIRNSIDVHEHGCASFRAVTLPQLRAMVGVVRLEEERAEESGDHHAEESGEWAVSGDRGCL